MMTEFEAHTVTLRGADVRDALLARVKARVAGKKLVIVQVGDDPASTVYVAGKKRAADAVGLAIEVMKLPVNLGEEGVLEEIARQGADDGVTGMIVQLPLPEGWKVQRILDAIPAEKDVDGLGTTQRSLQAAGDARAIWPATPVGVMRLLKAYGIEVAGKKAVVVGQSNLVGRPLALLLQRAGASVVNFGKAEPDPAGKARQADILCVATGVVGLVTRAWVKPGAVVVDVGITRRARADGTVEIVGDVADEVNGVAGALTPVPGGVGPLSVASLLANVVGILD